MTHPNQAPQGHEAITLSEIQSAINALRDMEPELLPTWSSADPAKRRQYLDLSDSFSVRVKQLTTETPATASQIIDTLMGSEDPSDRIAGIRTLSAYHTTRAYEAPDEVGADVVRWQQALDDPDETCRTEANRAAWALTDEPSLPAFNSLHSLMVERWQADFAS